MISVQILMITIIIIDLILLRRQALAFYAAAAFWELKIVACE